MAQITLIGDFTGGTGAVAWDILGINNSYHAHHVENGSFNAPLTLPPGLYNLVLDGGCAGKLKFDISGNIGFSSPSLPDTITGDGAAFKSLYAIHIV